MVSLIYKIYQYLQFKDVYDSGTWYKIVFGQQTQIFKAYISEDTPVAYKLLEKTCIRL